MFILHSSNKTQNLLAHLTTVLQTAPLTSPFEKELFLIQSQGMERWLSQQLAVHFKVWGNYEFLFPSRFFNTLAQQLGISLQAEMFEREVMVWRFEEQLRNLEGDVFTPLKYYLAADNSALKRFQLAQQLAQLFDQYQLMRPDMLTAWQHQRLLYHSDSERWQQALWQQLLQGDDSPHRGALWQSCITTLSNSSNSGLSAQLPERISVFGINTLPPLFLDFLQGLARHCDVHFYLLNPAQAYWADLESKTQRATQPEDALSGHPLLATLGQQGREFQQMLLQQVEFEAQVDSFEAAANCNNLQQLQNDILNNQPQVKVLQQDGSISVHACHSRMREVQVLKDQLLQTLAADATLELRDMVVMAPDIQEYAPFIAAVFDELPHAIADRSLRASNALLDSYINFLHLSRSRFGWQGVMDLLLQPVIYTVFGLSETDLQLIQHWLQETNVRWGRSADHKAELGLPALNENTWQATLERLLMGYAVGCDAEFVDQVLPYSEIEGSSAQALGGLNDFLQLLFKASKMLQQPRPILNWSEQLMVLATQLFANSSALQNSQTQVLQLHELLAELSDKFAAIHTHDVSFEVILAWLQSRVEENKSVQGFLRGQLTFCSMLPMRSIPFEVIALLGMNEGEFPKIDRHATFDLLAEDFRLGDRSRRADDRYQFLEILLAAGSQLIITYVGQSISQNQTIPPAVVISEVVEILQTDYQLQNVVQLHPLQAFSQRYFDQQSQLFSYSAEHCATAKSLAEARQPAAVWWQGESQPENNKTIDLHDFFAFYRHPQRYFFQRQLSINYTGLEARTDEREPFQLNALDAYWINQQWIASELAGEPLSLEKLLAQGAWYSGAPGKIEFARNQEVIANFVDLIKQKNLGARLPELDIDIQLGSYRLLGKLQNCYEQGSLFYRFAKLKGQDLLQAWLQHLLINTAQAQNTHLLSKDEDLLWHPESARTEELQQWLEIYLLGQKRPDVFFVEPAFAYIQQVYKLQNGGRARQPAIDVAMVTLEKAINSSFEPELQRLYSATEDLSMVLDKRFEQQCQKLLLPAWEAAHGE